ncbi:hypothetical protein CR513_14221, partial [Mucuna pruriens]
MGSPTSIQGGVLSTRSDTLGPNLPESLHYTSQQKGWLGVPFPLPNTSLFSTYTASSKGFKSCFVKIKAVEGGRFCADPRPLPLYWREPLKFKGLLRNQLSLEARVDLQLLDELLRGMNCKEIVAGVSFTYGMLKKQGFNIEELIRRSKLTNKARSTPVGSKKIDDVEVEAVPAVAEKMSTPIEVEKESALVVEKESASHLAMETSAATGGSKGVALTNSAAAKRKVEALSAEEAAKNKGKTVAPSQPAPAPPR